MVVSTLSMPGLAARLPRCFLAVVGDALVVVETNVAHSGPLAGANSCVTVVFVAPTPTWLTSTVWR